MMTPERLEELRSKSGHLDPDLEGFWLKECLDEIDRLENITQIQQKQIHRLMEARDAEIRKNQRQHELRPA